MSKEQRENILENMLNRLSDEEINELVKKHPGLKLDEGNQHFVVEQKNERGEITRSVFIPTWKRMPKEEGGPVRIEEELNKYFNPEESDKG